VKKNSKPFKCSWQYAVVPTTADTPNIDRRMLTEHWHCIDTKYEMLTSALQNTIQES